MMSGVKLDVIWSPVQHDKFILWGPDITLYEVARIKEIEKKTTFVPISSTRGATVVASQSANGVRCVDISAIPDQPEPLLALGYASGRVSLSTLKQTYDPLGLVGREFTPRHPRLCNSVSWSHMETNLLAVAMEKHRSDHCILLWDVSRGLLPEEAKDGSLSTCDPSRPIAEMGLSETAHSVAWSSCSNRTLIASMNLKYIKIFDLRELSNKGVSTTTSRYCYGACADPFNPWQLASRGDNVACVWDSRALHKPVLTLTHPRTLTSVQWCPTRVLNGSSSLDKSRVEELMGAGLDIWAPHGGLQFSMQDSGKADIMVFFASGEHGDGFPFDGQGRVVAHAFPPPLGGMHFDDDEVWGDSGDVTEEDDTITDFFAVAVHEIGHALGLSHSNVKSSVMYPYYQEPVDVLHMDDIMGMHELYLKNQPLPLSEPTPSPAPVPRFTKADSDELDDNYMPDLCMTNYDTLQVLQGKIYVFEEEWVWVLKDRNVMEAGYPQPFHDVFRGLPARVNTVRTIYERANGNVVIFSGRNLWEFAAADRGYRLIQRGNISEYSVPSYVSELTTVFVSNYNNKTYLIEEERFWRYDEKTQTMDPGYPKEMSAWRQVPYPVDAAIIWKGDTYFFQGPRFWRFDNLLVAAHDYYPVPVAQIWFNCPYTPEMNKYVTNDGP